MAHGNINNMVIFHGELLNNQMIVHYPKKGFEISLKQWKYAKQTSNIVKMISSLVKWVPGLGMSARSWPVWLTTGSRSPSVTDVNLESASSSLEVFFVCAPWHHGTFIHIYNVPQKSLMITCVGMLSLYYHLELSSFTLKNGACTGIFTFW